MLRSLKFPGWGIRITGRIAPTSASQSTPAQGVKALSTTSPGQSRYHLAAPGDTFNNGRYITVKGLGQGRYSHVWLAKDLEWVHAITKVSSSTTANTQSVELTVM
jgi:hypothetical protein